MKRLTLVAIFSTLMLDAGAQVFPKGYGYPAQASFNTKAPPLLTALPALVGHNTRVLTSVKPVTPETLVNDKLKKSKSACMNGSAARNVKNVTKSASALEKSQLVDTDENAKNDCEDAALQPSKVDDSEASEASEALAKLPVPTRIVPITEVKPAAATTPKTQGFGKLFQ